jgi:UDPglucose--hexose-1-phosphate uridylyltransferase
MQGTGKTPELRKDPVIERWVVIATGRGQRPAATVPHRRAVRESACPFCPGNEHMAPPEIYADRDQLGCWDVRVVPNKFPTLRVEGDTDRRGPELLRRTDAVGADEVIIEGPDHRKELPDLGADHVVRVLRAYKARLDDLRGDTRLRHIVVFRNFGEAAGATLSHPHSQLVALPITPHAVEEKLEGARIHFARHRRCIFCDVVEQELQERQRVVMETEHFVVLTPFASRFPFELCIYPRVHQHDFVLATDDEQRDLAAVLVGLLSRLRDRLDNPPYNMVLQTSPTPWPHPGRPEYWTTLEDDYHWHVEILPRLTDTTGLDWGTGLYVNPTSPESAAETLRRSVP